MIDRKGSAFLRAEVRSIMRRMTLRPVRFVLSFFALFACGDDDRDGSTAYLSSCEAACMRLHDCNSMVDIDACSMECKEDAAGVGPNLSSEFITALDACIADASCVQLAAQPVSQACQREAAARLGPSPAAELLCEAVVDSIRMCLGVTVGPEGCLNGAKIFNDAVLHSARSCDQMSCDQRSQCLEDKLGTDPSDM